MREERDPGSCDEARGSFRHDKLPGNGLAAWLERPGNPAGAQSPWKASLEEVPSLPSHFRKATP